MQRRRISRLVGAAAMAAAAAVLGIGGQAAAAPRSGSQIYYVATTSASAAAFQLTQRPAASIITENLVNDSLGYTATTFDSSQGSEAQAASVYPGSLVVQGPSLLCNEGVLPFACPVKPPAYPLLADAQYPQHPRATAGPSAVSAGKGAGKAKSPLTAQAGRSTATAGQRSATGDTTGGSAGLLARTPVAVAIGTQTSHTTVTTGKGGMTVRVISRAADISVGTLLHIGSVTGTVVQHLAPRKKPVDSPSVTVSNVTVAGHSASIGSHGLQVAGRKGPQLLRRLAAQNIKVSPVTVDRNDGRHGARSEVTGLVITTSLPVKNTPYIPNPVSSIPPFNQVPITGVDLNGTYITRLQLGAAGSAAAVQRQADIGLGGLGPQPVQPVKHLARPPAATGSGSTVTGPSGGSAAPPSTGVSRPNPGSPPRVAAATPHARGFLDAFTLDLSHFYLVLALGAGALFVGWRVRAGTRGRHWIGRRWMRSS